ncbi:rhodanese-like domain-containing protein [Propionibacteriaceae bacterium G1746]|uniref:rhodanese-like domain-containing protein n=1 Tax=Aestuariimicrobium sp. G57 TaxID=3418485 RepID=UPI003C1B1517
MGWFNKSVQGGIDVATALQLLAKGGVLVDVRTLREYEAGHAPGARLVDPKLVADDPWTAVHSDDPLAEPDGVMVFICDTGLRSSMAAKISRDRGYNAEFVANGLRGWREDGQYLIPGPPRNRR